MYTDPLAFLITFTTYGTWLHGTKKGSVDPLHNKYGEDFVEEDTDREQHEFYRLKCPPVYLTPQQRATIESAMREACIFRQWTVHEINVRTNHVHIVVTANEAPKTVIEKLKTRATMAIRHQSNVQSRHQSRDRKVAPPLWTRGGSGRYLWNTDAVQAACQYVRDQDNKSEPPSEPQSEPQPEGCDPNVLRNPPVAPRVAQPSGCGSD